MKKKIKTKRKSQAMYGISRIDSEQYRTHAWRVSLRRHGKGHVKNFSDKTHGGKQKALLAAKTYRDSILILHPPMTRQEFATRPRSNNKSGITGVYKYVKKYSLKDGRERGCWYWEANWPTATGESASARFSIKEYGEDGARDMAVQARERGLKGVEGIFWASERGSMS